MFSDRIKVSGGLGRRRSRAVLGELEGRWALVCVCGVYNEFDLLAESPSKGRGPKKNPKKSGLLPNPPWTSVKPVYIYPK